MTNLNTTPTSGLNFADELCFWCNTKTGRKIIHGYSTEPIAAHYRDFKPCKSCEATMSEGITFIQCSNTPNDYPPISESMYPTGIWLVMKEEWVRASFKEDAAVKIIADKAVHVNLELWANLGLPNLTTELLSASVLETKDIQLG